MLLWVIFALMTAAVLIAVLGPLARPAAPEATPDTGALEVYRHQLSEIEAERSRGLVDAPDAEAARIEISRRLLASAERAEPATAASPQRSQLAMGAAAFVTLASLAVYLAYGAPGLPGFPVSDRQAGSLEGSPLADLIAKVEARLRDEPRDGDGWDVIAPIYLKLERFADAARAYARSAELKGDSVARLVGRAEASVMAADGVVTEEARLASQKVLKLEPGQPQARFWLALAREQDGQLAEAVADYKALLAAAPADAPWRATVEQRIVQANRRIAGTGDKGGARGPTQQDVAAAQNLTEAQRAQMIAGMVEGLAQRLQTDGKDLAGWLRLVNAYMVLGREQDARAALGTARKQLAGDRKAEAELAALAKRLGLGS